MPAFDIGAVFNRFFKLIGENFGVFALLGLVGVVLPSVAVSLGITSMMGNVMGSTDPTATYMKMFTGPALGMTLGGSIMLWALNLVVLSMITEVAILRAIDKPIDMSGIFGQALRNILPLFVVSLLVFIMIFAGMIALIIPGIFLAIATCVAIPSYVGEPGRGIMGSISRSFELTKGRRWWLVLIFFIAFIASMVIGGIAGMLSLPFMFLNGAATSNPANLGAAMMPVTLINAAIDGVLRVFGIVMIAAIYVTLRESRERLTPENTANVFN